MDIVPKNGDVIVQFRNTNYGNLFAFCQFQKRALPKREIQSLDSRGLCAYILFASQKENVIGSGGRAILKQYEYE